MNRRLFFRAFAGAPVVAAAAIVPGAPRQLEVTSLPHFCACGCALFYHGHNSNDRYATCSNQECPQFNVPLAAPRLAVERADPAIVRRVQAEETEADREREKAREEEKPSRFPKLYQQ